MVATLLSVWFASRFLDRRRFSDLGVHLGQRAWWPNFGFGLALGTVTLSVLILVALVAGWITLEPVFASGIPGTSFVVAVLGSLWMYGIISIIRGKYVAQFGNLPYVNNSRFVTAMVIIWVHFK